MKKPHASENIIKYVNTLCERYNEDPLEQEVLQTIIAETGIPLETSRRELGRHLANIEPVISHRHEAPLRKERAAAERKAYSRLQKLVSTLSMELQTLSDPESPLSRALSKATFSAVAANEPGLRSLSRLIAFVDSEPVKSAEGRLQDCIEAVRAAVARLGKYTDRDFPTVSPAKSAAFWNTFYVGEVLPALFEHHFGRPFGVTKDPMKGGPPRGPAVRFLSASTKAIGIFGRDGKPYEARTLVGYWETAKKNPSQQAAWVKNAIHEW